MVQTSITMPNMDFACHGGMKSSMYFYLFVCLSVMLLNGRVCANDFAIKALECGNAFDAVGLRKVCSCAPAFNFVSVPLGENAIKFCFFCPLKNDIIN